MKNRRSLSPMGAALAARFHVAVAPADDTIAIAVPAEPDNAAAAAPPTTQPPAPPDEESPEK